MATPTATFSEKPSLSPMTPLTTSIRPAIRLNGYDLTEVCKAIGGLSADERGPTRRTSMIWPPKAAPEGLYKDVIRSRCKSQYTFYTVATIYNAFIVLQLVLGATLTALGGSDKNRETVITTLAAVNTVTAGLLALIHNSGLPERLRGDWTEYSRVEMFLTELINSGIVRDGVTKDDVIADCYARYFAAREAVSRSKPTSYVGTPTKSGFVG